MVDTGLVLVKSLDIIGALQREVGAGVRAAKQDEERWDDNMISDLIKHYGA